MALLYRKKVRDAIRSLLTTGFNSTLSTVCQVYGVDPFTLDFSDGSGNFAVCHIDPANVEKCQFQFGTGNELAACLYTTEAMDTGSPHGFSFAGKVMANLDFYVRARNGVEETNSEDIFDAIEDAALTVLNDRTNHWASPGSPVSLNYSREIECGREYLIPLADGYATRIPIRMLFGVKAP